MADNFETLFHTKENVLMHGPGGTGKTYHVTKLIEYLKEEGETTVAFLAPTGTAASNIGGMTIHSYFKISVFLNADTEEEEIDNAIRRSGYKPHGLNLLIIDEISMVGSKLFRIIDGILRKNYDLTKVMGGVRCIFSGDFYQLPPVKDEFCFSCDLWNQMNLLQLVYSEQKRYTCNLTFELLMRLRKNALVQADKDVLNSRVAAFKNREYEQLEIPPILIYTRKDDVDALNTRKLKEINAKEYKYTATNVLKTKNKRLNLPQSVQDRILDEIVNRVCTLKVGAVVILYRNYDMTRKLNNGTSGIITEINEEHNVVRMKTIDGVVHEIRPKEYSITGPDYTLSRTQIPLMMGYAITNYKCQGMTLDSAIVKLADCFAYGQVYTTIARVVSLDRLYIIDINYNKIKAIDYEE